MATTKLTPKFNKETPIFQILEMWKTLEGNEIVRKHNQKQETFVLIQDRKKSLQVLFDWLSNAGIPQDKVRDALVRISYACISKYQKRKERKGWAIMVSKDVSEIYNETYGDSLDPMLLAVAILKGNPKATFKMEFEEEEEEIVPEELPKKKFDETKKTQRWDDSEDLDESDFQLAKKNEFVPSGVKHALTVVTDEILTFDQVMESLMGGESK